MSDKLLCKPNCEFFVMTVVPGREVAIYCQSSRSFEVSKEADAALAYPADRTEVL